MDELKEYKIYAMQGEYCFRSKITTEETDIPRCIRVLKDRLRDDTLNVEKIDFLVFQRSVTAWTMKQ